MKVKNILIALVGVLAFLLLSKLIPYSKKTSSTVNYAPEGYSKTIKVAISDIVVDTKQQGQFWVTLSGDKYPFSYDPYKLPKNWQQTYPKEFILPNDSIVKASNNDTFYVIRNFGRWLYVLPR